MLSSPQQRDGPQGMSIQQIPCLKGQKNIAVEGLTSLIIPGLPEPSYPLLLLASLMAPAPIRNQHLLSVEKKAAPSTQDSSK